MTHKTVLSLLLLIIVAILPLTPRAGAQQSAPDAPQAPSAERSAVPEITETTSCGERCELFALSNGLKILVKKIPGAPITSVWAYVQKTGSQNEGRWLGTGISHYVEHLVCGGTTPTRGKEQTREIIDSLGGGMNAFTGKAITSYYINSPAQKAEVACDLIADWLQNCAFNPEEVQSEKHVILQE
ncbi:MAG: insulinase family protein, partial [Thermoguttaceae bacterium]|nr:insulinase family protein [Thermoguttaceae bacterium]